MVVVVFSVEYEPRKGNTARDLLKRVISYEKEAFGVESQLMQRVTSAPGQNSRLAVTKTFDSLAAWGDFVERRRADPAFQALMDEGFRSEDACFTHNTLSSSVYQVL